MFRYSLIQIHGGLQKKPEEAGPRSIVSSELLVLNGLGLLIMI